MKKYMVVTSETLTNLGKCFSTIEELETFVLHLDELGKEIMFSTILRNKVGKDNLTYVVLKQISILALFCRENMELMQQLVNRVEYKEISEDEAEEIWKQDISECQD